jgi:PAS domain S-box-containing protein
VSQSTDQRTIAQQLADVDDARALLEGLFLHSPMAYQIYRADGVSMLVNPAFMAMYGAAPPPEYNVFKDEILERNGFLGLVRRAFAGETVRIPPTWYDPREHRDLQTEGARRVAIDVTLFPLRDAAGVVRHVAVCAKDVTAQFELEATSEALRLRERRLQLAFDAANLVAWDVDLQTGQVQLSDNARKVFGLSPETPLSTLEDTIALVHPDDLPGIRDALGLLLKGIPPANDRFRIISPATKQVRWFERRSRIEGEPGNLWLRGIVMDVTERVDAEEALRVSEARYRTQFEAAPEAIVTLDAEVGRFVEVNEHAQRLLGYTRAQLLTMGPFDISPEVQPDGRVSAEFGREVIARALAGERPAFEWTHRNAAGEDFPCEIRLVRLPGGRALCRGSIIDIGERKRAEAERARLEAALHRAEENLRQSQKMEAIGRLAGGVAHDFNNLLSVILGYCDILLGDLRPEDPMRADLESVRRSGQQAADLTRQLLAFSRQQVLAPRVLDLNDVVRNADKMLGRLLGEDIELSAACCEGLARVRVDPGQIDQVIMNLAINARDAMPRGGKLTVETSRILLDADYAAANPGVSPGPHVVLAVSDTGVGIAHEVQPRIFEPFFTTKDRGKGTGLGLSTVFGIVQQSGGHVTVYSEPGAGTTFRIYLPESQEDETPAASSAEPITLSGTEAILLVEDQEQVRQVAQEILRRQGYTVLAASDVDEAIRLCARRELPIALLLTDVVMPRMSGPELAQQLVTVRPEMKVIFMSGYTEQAVVKHGVLDAAAAYVAKPLVPATLARKVREVLDGK